MSALAAVPALAPRRHAAADRLDVAVGIEATAPIEADGLPRDAARMLVVSSAGLVHAQLRDLPDHLDPGDVLVVNTSAVLPAALPARDDGGRALRLHLSTLLPGGWWLVEPRRNHGTGSRPHPDARGGETLDLPAGGTVTLLSPHAPQDGVPPRLWLAELRTPEPLPAYLDRHGTPIRYGDHGRTWPLATYQTVFAAEPGSVESPSAGRGFTGELVARLVARGVTVVGLTLHCGVSSPEAHEVPGPERYRVPTATAAAVNAARGAGRRVIAVGTTVVRALETVANDDGSVHPGRGWTQHVVAAGSRLRSIDGLLTGWHEPEASHLHLLAAVASTERLRASYAAAAAAGYRWHELGDVHLLLP